MDAIETPASPSYCISRERFEFHVPVSCVDGEVNQAKLESLKHNKKCVSISETHAGPAPQM